MYRSCLFCHIDLRHNDRNEHLPIGRRQAFDAQRGRLWVVCRRCGGWNLTPFAQRWEAIETLERLFHSTSRVARTSEISLAHLPGDFEIVRVGAPTLPEYVGWRYGSRLARRWRRAQLLLAGAATASLAGSVGAVGLAAAAIKSGAGAMLLGYGALWLVQLTPPPAKRWLRARISGRRRTPEAWRSRNIITKIAVGSEPVTVYRSDLDRLVLREQSAGWALRVRKGVMIKGDVAMQVLGQVLPVYNRWGGSKSIRSQAVTLLETAGGPGGYIDHAVRQGLSHLRTTPPAARFALEIAAHEASERYALEVELRLLEAAWRDAEEIAAIADGLLVPPAVERALARLKR